jgi:hypothetical protein
LEKELFIMAKRKRIPGGGSKLRPIKDYRSHEYVPYIFSAETGILQAWKVDPDIRDGDVRQALRDLISPLQKSGELPEVLTQPAPEEFEIEAAGKETLLRKLILHNLSLAFDKYGPLEAQDLVGVLKVINNSIGAWNIGLSGQGYLNYLEGFMGQMGASTVALSPEEVKRLGLDEADRE